MIFPPVMLDMTTNVGGEGRMKAAWAARRRRGPHEGGEGRMKAAWAARRRRGLHVGGEGRMKAARAA